MKQLPNTQIKSMKYIHDHVNIRPFFKQVSLIISIHTELPDLGTKILPLKQLPELTFAKS